MAEWKLDPTPPPRPGIYFEQARSSDDVGAANGDSATEDVLRQYGSYAVDASPEELEADILMERFRRACFSQRDAERGPTWASGHGQSVSLSGPSSPAPRPAHALEYMRFIEMQERKLYYASKALRLHLRAHRERNVSGLAACGKTRWVRTTLFDSHLLSVARRATLLHERLVSGPLFFLF